MATGVTSPLQSQTKKLAVLRTCYKDELFRLTLTVSKKTIHVRNILDALLCFLSHHDNIYMVVDHW